MEFHIPQWAKDHPYATGIGVFLVGLFILYELGWFGGSSSGGSTDALSSYYAAEAAAAQSGNALAATQDALAAQTNQAQIAAGTQTGLATIAAGRDVSLANIYEAINHENTQAAVDVAKTQAQVQGQALTDYFKTQQLGITTGAATAVTTAQIKAQSDAYQAGVASYTLDMLKYGPGPNQYYTAQSLAGPGGVFLGTPSG